MCASVEAVMDWLDAEGRNQLGNHNRKKAHSLRSGGGTTVSGQRGKRKKTGKRKCWKLKR